MKRKTEKTTILFVNKNSRGIKPIQVSSQLILNWKKYLLGVSLMFIFLIGTIAYLASNKIKQNQLQEALSKKLQSMHLLIAEVDTNAVREKFTKIDKELSTINGYLNRIIYNISYTPLGLPFPGAITSSFGHRENPFGGADVETHKGLDIKGPYGAEVKAMAKGEVQFAGTRGGYGNCIILKHGNGFETLYGHLSKILVHPGQKIEIGDQIGNIGSTGRSTGPHLHYEVHRNGQKINPEAFLTLN
jgi:murein DD-endopeptidase MepM/ murein hydrolase activator NlpD